MILLPGTPKIRLSACAAAAALSVALFLSSNSLNQLRLQAWEDIHWRKIPPISAEIRKTWNHTDKEMYEIMHPDSRPGLAGIGIGLELERHLNLCKIVLKLPLTASGDEVREAIYLRTAKLRERGVPYSQWEAQQIVGVADPYAQELVMTRLYFLDNTLCYYNSIDPRLGTNCGGSEWQSPFSLIAEENLVFKTRATLIDDLTFGLL
ncbi:MAG: hypothetical protein WCT03_24750 [Candidatus Obscuribacterales bacterium]|jgi:hypothetical protein